MKIIRPVDLAGNFESSAPPEGYPLWEPIGADYAQDLDGPVIGASLAHLYVMSGAPGSYDLRRHDTVTGETVSIALSWVKTSGAEAVYIAAAPDDSHVAITFKVAADSYSVDIYKISTGLRVLASPTLWYKWSRTVFSEDSTRLIHSTFRDNAGVTESRITFSNLVNSSLAHSAWLSHGDSDAAIHAVTGLCYDSTSGVAWATLNSITGGGGVTTGYIMRFDGTATAQVRDNYGAFNGAATFFDASTGEIGVFKSSNISFFNGSTLAQTSSVSLPSGGIRSFSESADGASLYLSVWTQPYVRVYAIGTRVLQSSASGISPLEYPSYGSKQYLSISASNSYLFVRQAEGFVAASIPDLSIVTQTNPTVTAGDIYTYSSTNYEALTDNNARPDLGALLEVPTWLNLGAVNPLRMFDGKLDTLTTAPSPLTVNITPGQLANGIALFNVSAQTVQITMTDPTEGLVYDSGEIQMLDNASIRDWYGFFFEPYLRKADAARINLPPYPDATITVTLSAPGEEVSAGQLVLGTIQRLGNTVYGTSVGITDFSRKEQDVFGNFEIVERRFSKRAEFDVSIDTRSVASAQRTLAAYRTEPLVWVGAEEQEETIVYGYYRDFDIVIANYSTSDATITVEGL